MNNLFLTVLSLTIICSVVIAFVIVLDKIFYKNYSRQWKYIIWAVITLRLILPININVIDIPILQNVKNSFTSQDRMYFDMTSNSNKFQSGNDLTTDDQQTMTDAIEITSNRTPSKIASKQKMLEKKNNTANTFSSYSVLDVISIIWIIGVILFLFYHLLSHFYYKKKLYRWSSAIENNDILELFHNLCTELGIKRQINIVTCNQAFSPMLVGFIKPYIVLPVEDFTMEQYNFILKHELIHYKHRDLFYKAVLLCANALHWFNPLIHYMVYLANTDMELYCDEKLIAKNDRKYRENYSLTILQIMTGARKNNHILLSTNFSRKNKQVKNRFFQIMNARPTKKGTCFIISMICLIVIVGNIIIWFVPAETSAVINKQNSTQDTISNAVQNTPDQLEKTSHILVVGIDAIDSDEYARADSILVVSVNPITKKMYLTSFLRDMYVEIPDRGKNKLGAVYKLGGTDLIKNTIETNFDLTIDHTVTVNMDAFETIINSIGGVEIEVSEKEAEYLNKTNFISNKKYRTVIAGKQILNGNQALGYLRIRNIPTLQGEMGDAGRATRLRNLISSISKEYSKNDIIALMKLLMNAIPKVTTDLSPDQIYTYLNTALQDGVTTNSLSIPVEGSYTQEVQEGRSVLKPNLDKNIKVIKQILN